MWACKSQQADTASWPTWQEQNSPQHANHPRTSKNCGTRRLRQISKPLQDQTAKCRYRIDAQHAAHQLTRISLHHKRLAPPPHRTVACSARQQARTSEIQNSVFHRSCSLPVCRGPVRGSDEHGLRPCRGQVQGGLSSCAAAGECRPADSAGWPSSSSAAVVLCRPVQHSTHLSQVEGGIQLLHCLRHLLRCLVGHRCRACGSGVHRLVHPC